MTDLTAQQPLPGLPPNQAAPQLPLAAATDPQPAVKPRQPSTERWQTGAPGIRGYTADRLHQQDMTWSDVGKEMLDWVEKPENQRFLMETLGAEALANATGFLVGVAAGAAVGGPPGAAAAGGVMAAGAQLA